MKPVAEYFVLLADLALARGHKSIKDLPGCLEMTIDDRWWVAFNGHGEPTKCSKDIEVEPYGVYAERLGWPALVGNAFGGEVMGGTEDEFCGAVRAALEASDVCGDRDSRTSRHVAPASDPTPPPPGVPPSARLFRAGRNWGGGLPHEKELSMSQAARQISTAPEADRSPQINYQGDRVASLADQLLKEAGVLRDKLSHILIPQYQAVPGPDKGEPTPPQSPMANYLEQRGDTLQDALDIIFNINTRIDFNAPR